MDRTAESESENGVRVPRVRTLGVLVLRPPITIDCREIGCGITKKNKNLI